MGLARFGRYAGFRCRQESGGKVFEAQAIDLRVANGCYQGGVLGVEGAESIRRICSSGSSKVVQSGRWPALGRAG